MKKLCTRWLRAPKADRAPSNRHAQRVVFSPAHLLILCRRHFYRFVNWTGISPLVRSPIQEKPGRRKAIMTMIRPVDDSTEKFQLKLIEILGKGFRDSEPHDFIKDIEQSRCLYQVLERYEVEYFVVTAVLSLESLVEATCFLNTLRDILTFYENVLKAHIISYASRMECLKAIEDCCLHSHHLKDRQATAFIIHFFYKADILDAESVLTFFDQLEDAESPLLEQESLKTLIGWTRHESLSRPFLEEDNNPMSYLLKKTSRSLSIKPFYVWMKRPGEFHNPAYGWERTDEPVEIVKSVRKLEHEDGYQPVRNRAQMDGEEPPEYEVYDEDVECPYGMDYDYDEDAAVDGLFKRRRPKNFMQAYKDYI